MTSLKILICGGGCAGPALAFWLARNGHRVVVVERSPQLRAAGAQVDLRAQGIEVVKRMGLIDAVRSRLVDEAGVKLTDSEGRVYGTIMANTSGKGAQSLTSEYEIMRRDLVQVLYEATGDDVEYVFGKTVDRFEQDEKEVRASFSDGSSDTFDVLVGADGQGSRIRQAILPANAPSAYKHTGIYMAYWMVPKEEGDDNFGRSYLSSGGRMIMRRTHNSTETQVYFILIDKDPELKSVSRAPVEQQKTFWSSRFHDAGWQCPRFIKGMQTAENFYSHEVVQVCTDTWSKGRVVLLGDAGYCPSPMTGMGTTGCLVGAYVLAGEINRHSDDLSQAFANYEKTLRPFVDEIQKFPFGLVQRIFPRSEWAVRILLFLTWLVCASGITGLASRFQSEDKGGWPLPDYPGLRA